MKTMMIMVTVKMSPVVIKENDNGRLYMKYSEEPIGVLDMFDEFYYTEYYHIHGVYCHLSEYKQG